MTRDKQNPSSENLLLDMNYEFNNKVAQFQDNLFMIGIDNKQQSRLVVQGLFKVNSGKIIEELIYHKQ